MRFEYCSLSLKIPEHQPSYTTRSSSDRRLYQRALKIIPFQPHLELIPLQEWRHKVFCILDSSAISFFILFCAHVQRKITRNICHPARPDVRPLARDCMLCGRDNPGSNRGHSIFNVFNNAPQWI